MMSSNVVSFFNVLSASLMRVLKLFLDSPSNFCNFLMGFDTFFSVCPTTYDKCDFYIIPHNLHTIIIEYIPLV